MATSLPLATLIVPEFRAVLAPQVMPLSVTVPGPLTVKAPAEVLLTSGEVIVSASLTEVVRTTSSPPAVAGAR